MRQTNEQSQVELQDIYNNLRDALIGSWSVENPAGNDWILDGEEIEFYPNGTGAEQNYAVKTFTWSIEEIARSANDDIIPNLSEDDHYQIRMIYEDRELILYPSIYGDSQIYFYQDAGPPVIFTKLG